MKTGMHFIYGDKIKVNDIDCNDRREFPVIIPGFNAADIFPPK
jgi:hypothetical protein